ncbi:MAG: Smr/MutS family protein [Gammaproteobacteria bacterium]|nr:Smr/MutS family protein [Gammaproteobacteria bacterium]
MSKKPEISEEDQSLFRQAMRGVKRLSQPTKITPTMEPPKPRVRSKIEQAEMAPAPLSDYEKQEAVSSEDLIEFNRPGIQHKILRKMRLGQYNVDAILDLHGMHADEAKESLHHFLLQCLQKGVTHVLVIHGKGRGNTSKPILKNKLNNWLRQLEYVLAFCSAAAKDGRSGALYVLLKNQKGR